jgi:hypothetical protein
VSAIAVVVYHLIAGRKSPVFRTRGRKQIQFLLLTFGLGLGAFLFLVFGTYMGQRLVETFAPMQALSFQFRLLVWTYHLQIFLQSSAGGRRP